MIKYSDNPNLKLKTVTTVKGDTEYRRNCRFIKGQYYTKERDCFEVNGLWYRQDSGAIVYDQENNKWVLKKTEGLFHGIVGFEKDGTPLFGYFTPNIYNNCYVNIKDAGKHIAINSDILAKNGYFEDLGVGVWYFRKDVTTPTYNKMVSIRNEKSYTDRGYNIEDNSVDFNRKIKAHKEFDMYLSKNVRNYSKFLGNTTFGAEVEVARGFMPDHVQNRLGIVPCRDGSIGGGPEFVSVPLSGAKGLQTLNDTGVETSLRGEIDINCSFHLHLGNVPDNRLFLTSIYILCLKIQDEIFTMFPYYKTNPSGIKKKNYNQKLKKMGIHPLVDCSKEGYDAYLDNVYGKIFSFLTEGESPNETHNRRQRRHPVAQKWNRNSRYYWMNLMNMIFSERNTVEFRLHTPTTNPQKMINWLFICNAIVKYAETNSKEILTTKRQITLKDVLSYYTTAFKNDKNAEFLVEYLMAYISERQKRFQKDYDRGDYVSQWEMDEDKSYRFSYGGVTNLF